MAKVLCQRLDDAGKLKASQLPPQIVWRRAHGIGLEKCLSSRAPDLAARRLGQGVRRREHNLVGRQVDYLDRDVTDRFHQRGAGGNIFQTRLREHDKAFAAGMRIRARKRRDATLAYAIQPSDGVLDLVGIDVAAGADDDVLDATCEIDISLGNIGQVAALQPFTVKKSPVLPLSRK